MQGWISGHTVTMCKRHCWNPPRSNQSNLWHEVTCTLHEWRRSGLGSAREQSCITKWRQVDVKWCHFFERPATFVNSDQQGTPIEPQIRYSCGENIFIYDIQATCPIGQPTLENWLSECQIYLSRTIGRVLFRTLESSGPHVK